MPALVLVLSTLMLSSPPTPLQPAPVITVIVDGARSDDGQAVVLLFSDPDGFPRKADRAFRLAHAPILNGAADVRLGDVPAGRYAVVAFHDADSDLRLDTNWIGLPTEGVAASNWTGGRPSFDDAAILLGPDASDTLHLTLRYR